MELQNSTHDGVQTFNFNGLSLRALLVDGEPNFILVDACKALDLSSPHKVAASLDEDDRNSVPVTDSLGRVQQTWAVTESGLYQIIFQSRKAEAKAFKRWVTHDVLPAIRKTGSYSAVPARELTGTELMAKALIHAQAVMAQKDLMIESQAQQIEASRPAVEYVQHCVSADDVLLMKDWGFEFGLTGLEAYDLLVERGIVYRKFIGERWSNKLMRKVKEYEYRPKPGVTADWFSLRAQHKAARHHNGQVRQTLYVKAIHSVDLAKRVGLISNEIVEAA